MAWVSALQSIAAGTMTVGQAFEAMGKQILDTMSQGVAAQMATMALFKLGAGLLTGALLGPTVTDCNIPPLLVQVWKARPVGRLADSGRRRESLIGLFGAQHGAGPITQPTNVLVGEGRTNPEWILTTRSSKPS